MKLTDIKELGRYKNTITGKCYNLKRGRNTQKGVDVVFYLYRGKRQIISDYDFYHNHEKIS